MIGEIAPYSLIGDNIVMSLFVLDLLGMAYVFLMNGNSILERAKAMFYYTKQSQPFNERTHIARICNVLLYWQTLFFCSITAFGYTDCSGCSFLGGTPYLLLVAYILLFATFFLVKSLLYDFCNIVLFSSKAVKEWRQSYSFTIKMLGFLLFPAVLGLIFVKGLLHTNYIISILFATLVYLFVIFNRSIRIIFKEKCNYLDVFLYLCALEFLPLAILWKLIHVLNSYLIIKF